MGTRSSAQSRALRAVGILGVIGLAFLLGESGPHKRCYCVDGVTPVLAAPGELFLVCLDGQWGYMDRSGRIAIEPRFSDGREFSEGLAAVSLGEGACKSSGYIDATGQMVIEAAFDDAYSFTDGLAKVTLGGLDGYVDASGALVIDAQFGFGHEFSEGVALVATPRGGIGPFFYTPPEQFFVDREGRRMPWPEVEDARGFSEGLAPAERNGRWGFIDHTGAFAIAPEYEWAMEFSEGLAAVCVETGEGKLCGFVDRTGRMVIAPRYPEVGPFREGLARAEVGSRTVYLDKTGREVFGVPFAQTGSFSEGIASVMDDVGRYGYIDRTGQLVIAPEFYPGGADFEHGLAMVTVVPRRNDFSSGFSWGYIDRSGRYVWPPTG
jgi:hypothetical protein